MHRPRRQARRPVSGDPVVAEFGEPGADRVRLVAQVSPDAPARRPGALPPPLIEGLHRHTQVGRHICVSTAVPGSCAPSRSPRRGRPTRLRPPPQPVVTGPPPQHVPQMNLGSRGRPTSPAAQPRGTAPDAAQPGTRDRRTPVRLVAGTGPTTTAPPGPRVRRAVRAACGRGRKQSGASRRYAPPSIRPSTSTVTARRSPRPACSGRRGDTAAARQWLLPRPVFGGRGRGTTGGISEGRPPVDEPPGVAPERGGRPDDEGWSARRATPAACVSAWSRRPARSDWTRSGRVR
jgi:hypothetical protein